MEPLTFSTKHGIIQVTPKNLVQFGTTYQCHGMTLISVDGVKRLQPKYYPLDFQFTQSDAEAIAELNSEAGKQVNQELLQKYLKEVKG